MCSVLCLNKLSVFMVPWKFGRPTLFWHTNSAVLRIRIHWVRIRIQHFGLNTYPNPRFCWLKNEKTYSWKFFGYFLIKNCYNLSLGLHKGRQNYRRSLQLSKENTQHFKTWNFFTFFYFYGSFLPSWIRIRIRWPDWIRIGIRNSGIPDFWSHKSSELFSTFMVIFALLDPDPDPLLWLNPDRNPKQWYSGFLIR